MEKVDRLLELTFGHEHDFLNTSTSVSSLFAEGRESLGLLHDDFICHRNQLAPEIFCPVNINSESSNGSNGQSQPHNSATSLLGGSLPDLGYDPNRCYMRLPSVTSSAGGALSSAGLINTSPCDWTFSPPQSEISKIFCLNSPQKSPAKSQQQYNSQRENLARTAMFNAGRFESAARALSVDFTSESISPKLLDKNSHNVFNLAFAESRSDGSDLLSSTHNHITPVTTKAEAVDAEVSILINDLPLLNVGGETYGQVLQPELKPIIGADAGNGALDGNVGDKDEDSLDQSFFLDKSVDMANNNGSHLLIDSNRRTDVAEDDKLRDMFDLDISDQYIQQTDLNDSVFLEGRILASRIQDGSILNDDDDVVDHFEPPDQLNDPIYDTILTTDAVHKQINKFFPPSLPDVANSTNFSSFMEVDENGFQPKISVTTPLPQAPPNTPAVTTMSTSDVVPEASLHEAQEPDCNPAPSITNKSGSTHVVNRLVTPTAIRRHVVNMATTGSTKSARDARHLLQNLSEIVGGMPMLGQQTNEAQQIIRDLASLFCLSPRMKRRRNTTANSTSSTHQLGAASSDEGGDDGLPIAPGSAGREDSGHSSIEESSSAASDANGSHEDAVLDLRVKSCIVTEGERRRTAGAGGVQQVHLDMSLRVDKGSPMPFLNNKQTSSSLSALPDANAARKPVIIEKGRSPRKTGLAGRLSSVVSAASKFSDGLGKWKPRKPIECGVIKKGPMKAVIPIGNMKLKCVDSKKTATSPRIGDEPLPAKRKGKVNTSTPKDAQVMPVAQSTPETNFGYSPQAKDRFKYSMGGGTKAGTSPQSPLTRNTLGGNTTNTSMRSYGSSKSGSAPDLSTTPGSKATSALMGRSSNTPTQTAKPVRSVSPAPGNGNGSRRYSTSDLNNGSGAVGRSCTSSQVRSNGGSGIRMSSPLARYSVSGNSGGDSAEQKRVSLNTSAIKSYGGQKRCVGGGNAAVAEKNVGYLTERNRNVMASAMKPVKLLSKLTK